MEKRRNCSLGAISPLFHNIFNISLTWESNKRFILLKVVVRLIVFLSSANLICRSTDISRCFIEYLGFRDNESRLYIQHSGRSSVCFLDLAKHSGHKMYYLRGQKNVIYELQWQGRVHRRNRLYTSASHQTPQCLLLVQMFLHMTTQSNGHVQISNFKNILSGHMTSIQSRINVNAM